SHSYIDALLDRSRRMDRDRLVCARVEVGFRAEGGRTPFLSFDHAVTCSGADTISIARSWTQTSHVRWSRGPGSGTLCALAGHERSATSATDTCSVDESRT